MNGFGSSLVIATCVNTNQKLESITAHNENVMNVEKYYENVMNVENTMKMS